MQQTMSLRKFARVGQNITQPVLLTHNDTIIGTYRPAGYGIETVEVPLLPIDVAKRREFERMLEARDEPPTPSSRPDEAPSGQAGDGPAESGAPDGGSGSVESSAAVRPGFAGTGNVPTPVPRSFPEPQRIVPPQQPGHAFNSKGSHPAPKTRSGK